MTSLREQLAARMFQLLVVHKAHVAPATARAVVGALADECIRQMEWARHDVRSVLGDREPPNQYCDEYCYVRTKDRLLSAAPEDWSVPR